MKVSLAEDADDASDVEPARPPWLADTDPGSDLRKVVIGRLVVGLVGLGLWWAEIPTRWVIWTWGLLMLLGYGLSYVSGRIGYAREDAGESLYWDGLLALSVAKFVLYVLLTVVMLRYGLSG